MFEILLTKKNYFDAMDLHYKKQNRTVYGFLFVLYLIYITFDTNPLLNKILTVVFFTLIVYVLSFILRKYSYSKGFKEMPKEYSLHFISEILHVTTQDEESSLKYTTFKKYKENKNVFLLYLRSNIFYIIPQRAFDKIKKQKLLNIMQQYGIQNN